MKKLTTLFSGTAAGAALSITASFGLGPRAGDPHGHRRGLVEASCAAAAGAAARPGSQGGTPPSVDGQSWVPGLAVDGVSGDAACAATACSRES
ncbi:hypothetical protein J2W14_001404 [Pseudarthrobacter oxydans]|nr:hypothetical protein [Pseudarthrobacter oxydans]